MRLRNFALASVLLVGGVGTKCVFASQFISDSYVRTGLGETLTASFAASSGNGTVGNYKGSIEIVVSGTGFSYGLNENDAFYCSAAADWRCSAPGVALDSQYYQLNIGFAGHPFAGGEANNISNFISFIDGAGSVVPSAIPAYQANHEYHFIVDLPTAQPSIVTFGVSDGIYSDNGGNFTVQVFQLAPIPEPETYAMLLAGLGLLGVTARRRRTSLND